MAVVSTSAVLSDRETEAEYCQRIVSKGGAPADTAGQAYCNLGVLHQGKEEEIGYYQKSIALKPMAFEPVYSLACAHATRQEWILATRYFHQALALTAPSDEELLLALKNLYRCVCATIQSDPTASSMSQQDLLVRLETEMGKENFALLNKLTKGTS